MRFTLDLPLPPSPNTMNGFHPIHTATAKRRYQKRCWADAIRQLKPFRDPPEHVTLSAHLRVHNLRDEDNLTGSLKYALDSLKQAQTGKDWRNGAYSLCGYFVDDDPKHLTVNKPTQEIDRSNKGLTLTIEWADETREAA